MMPRYGAKTYSRPSADSKASQAFDDMQKRPSIATKAASTAEKWGRASFTSTRSGTPVESEGPKRKVAETTGLFDDPFSFDDDDPSSRPTNPKRKYTTTSAMPQAVQKTAGKTIKKITVITTNNTKVIRAAYNSMDQSPVKESMLNRSWTDALKPLGTNSSVLDNKPKQTNNITRGTIRAYARTTTAKGGGPVLTYQAVPVKIKQVPIDKYVTKSGAEAKYVTKGGAEAKYVTKSGAEAKYVTKSGAEAKYVTKSSGSAPAPAPVVPVSQPVALCKTPPRNIRRSSRPKRFFTSSQSPPDHTYSQLSREMSDSSDSGEGSGDESNNGSLNGGARTLGKRDPFDQNSDFEFNSDFELDSGDPEIIFNSPRKRALEAQKRVTVPEVVTISDDDTRSTVSDRSHVDSPLTISSQSQHSTQSTETAKPVRFSHLKTYSRSASNAAAASNNNKFEEAVSSQPSTSASSAKTTAGTSAGTTAANTKRDLSSRLRLTNSSLLEDKLKKDKPPERPVVRRLLTSPKKARSVYNPRQWHSDNDGTPEMNAQGSLSSSQPATRNIFDGDFDEDVGKLAKPAKLKRTTTWPSKDRDEKAVSKIHVQRQHKPLFTVVRDVKQAHDVQEMGETQEYSDEIDYIIDGLENISISVRCLSAIGLVSKCRVPGFRMHLRAHGLMSHVFSLLHDAPQYPTLALCTAAILYMLSRDRLNMDLDKSSLELMLALLSVDTQNVTGNNEKEYGPIYTKIRLIFHDAKEDGVTEHLDIEDITTGNLAMETLLSLTSRRAGDWFKEELRDLGGLDHIVNTVDDCIDDLDEFEIDVSDAMIDRIKKIDRCLRVLENVSYLNVDNQNYLVMFNDNALIQSLPRTLKICENMLPFNTVNEDKDGHTDKECPGFHLLSCMLDILRVLLNLTHENKTGSHLCGQQPGLIKTLLSCILHVPQLIPPSFSFDLLVLSLGLLINIVEHCDGNKLLLRETRLKCTKYCTSAVPLEALSQLFVARLKAAKLSEEEQEVERKERKKRKAQKRAKRESLDSMMNADPEESGEWRESDSGLEWVTREERQRRLSTTSTPLKNINPKMPAYISDGESEESESDQENTLESILTGAKDEDQETLTNALHRAGRHMEDSIISAYISLLVGILIEYNSDLAEQVRDQLPDGDFNPMVLMLKKFLGFMNLTMGNAGAKSIMRIIQVLEAC